MKLLNRLVLVLPLAATLSVASVAHADQDVSPPPTASTEAASSRPDTRAPEPPPAWQVSPSSDLLAETGGDGRRTMGRFATNLGRNFIGVFSTDSLKPLLVGVAAAEVAVAFDGTAQSFASSHQTPQFASAGQTAGSAQVVAPLALGLLLAGRATPNTRFRAATYDIAQAFLVNAAWTTALKYATHRTRPDGSDNLSFPSGHTSNAFAWATVAQHHYGYKVGIPAYLAAGLIGASRIQNNSHHLSDVVAGAALGYIVGRTVVREDGQPLRKKTHLSVMPATAPSGTGVGMALSIDF